MERRLPAVSCMLPRRSDPSLPSIPGLRLPLCRLLGILQCLYQHLRQADAGVGVCVGLVKRPGMLPVLRCHMPGQLAAQGPWAQLVVLSSREG